MITATPENKLTIDDVKRINGCNDYKYIKNVLATVEMYKGFEVGSAVFIKKKGHEGYVTASFSTDNNPSKYLIVHNDNGFIFAKRILSSGKPGATIECLTIEYPAHIFTLMLDEEMVDAMLLDEEYDPTASAKNFKLKKNKATRINNKKRLKFNTPQEAQAYLESLTVGTKLWRAFTTFGDTITEYSVKSIKSFPCIYNIIPNNIPYEHRLIYQKHQEAGFKKVVIITLQLVVPTPSSMYYSDKEITFSNITSGLPYKYSNLIFFKEKPLTPEDIP